MASDTKNVKLGVCQVFFDNVDLGYTQGGVEVSVTTDTRKVEIDQFGKTPINEAIQGRQVSVKVPLAETTLRNLVKIMPGATLVTDGVQASGTVTFVGQPTAAQTVTIAGQVFTFQVGNPANIFQVKIGASVAASAQNLVDAINLSQISPASGGVIASLTGLVATVRAGDPGVAGNAVTLATNVTGASASGANLAGGVAETRARVDVSTGVGIDMLAIAKQLRLHPQGKAATDLSDDFIVHRTATPGALQFAYKTDAERVFNVEFMAYPDPITNKLYSVGDPLAV
jgi:energy-converting hydrogenase Eha subunit B